ncbi:UNVERIFIED_CONTAM: Beta-D-xylosidase 3 [Sesamum angustifolium]|uniref:Beta-D-xylosidase 3 n=1 Tax=Sesamum angustifolium TaxID=2727405 RepID=A0AAW2J6X9_9LAMI
MTDNPELKNFRFCDPSWASKRVDDLVSRLTLQEKIGWLRQWFTPGVSRLGIPDTTSGV